MDVALYAGDSRNLVVTVTDGGNNAIDLTSAAIEWVLTQNGATILSKSMNAGITCISPTAGQFTIQLTAENTKSLNGTYQQFARVTLPDGSSALVLTGNITVTVEPI